MSADNQKPQDQSPEDEDSQIHTVSGAIKAQLKQKGELEAALSVSSVEKSRLISHDIIEKLRNESNKFSRLVQELKESSVKSGLTGGELEVVSMCLNRLNEPLGAISAVVSAFVSTTNSREEYWRAIQSRGGMGKQ